MSGQLRFLLGYEQLVKNLLASLPEDDAAAQAVGGSYEHYGVLEHALLRGEGLRDGSAVIDVSCGSGRLATKLTRYPDSESFHARPAASPEARPSTHMGACFSTTSHALEVLTRLPSS